MNVGYFHVPLPARSIPNCGGCGDSVVAYCKVPVLYLLQGMRKITNNIDKDNRSGFWTRDLANTNHECQPPGLEQAIIVSDKMVVYRGSISNLSSLLLKIISTFIRIKHPKMFINVHRTEFERNDQVGLVKWPFYMQAERNWMDTTILTWEGGPRKVHCNYSIYRNGGYGRFSCDTVICIWEGLGSNFGCVTGYIVWDFV